VRVTRVLHHVDSEFELKFLRHSDT